MGRVRAHSRNPRADNSLHASCALTSEVGVVTLRVDADPAVKREVHWGPTLQTDPSEVACYP